MLLLDSSMQDQGRVLALSRPAFVWLCRVHTALICGLLALALLWVWLRSSTREHARRFARSAAPYGSRRAYLWELARHATDAAPWLMGCIILVGVFAGFLLSPYVSWWWGLVLAFAAASLAPAWAETTVGRICKR